MSGAGVFVTLGEVACEPVAQAGPTEGADFIYVDIGSVDRETKLISDAKRLARGDAPSRARQVLRADDVLVSMTRPNLNAVARIPALLDGAIGSTGFHVLRTRWMEPGFLRYLVQSTEFIDAMCAVVQGALYPAIRPADIAKFRFRLPPRAEQTRIVEKLEELLGGLDAAVAELKAAQRKLALLRQSLLKSAVEGALTASWRAAHAPKEGGAQLLQRILAERRTRWESRQLAKFAQAGKTPPKGWQAKYPEPVAPDTSDLPALPQGWVWATLSQLGWLDRGRSQHRPRNAPHLYGGSYPFIQTGDIRNADTFVQDVEVTYSEAGLAQSKLWPAGTMCITIAANIGKTAILGMDSCFPDSVVGFVPAADEVSIRYVEYFMRSAQKALEDAAPATAQKNINIEILEKVRVPLPPFDEQATIVEQLTTALAAVKEQEAAIAHGLHQAVAQRRNILRAAFAGQLVAQDPGDEPASALLARIRAGRAAQGSAKKPRGRKTKEAA